MNSEAPTNLQHKIPLTGQPTPINSVVFAGMRSKTVGHETKVISSDHQQPTNQSQS